MTLNAAVRRHCSDYGFGSKIDEELGDFRCFRIYRSQKEIFTIKLDVYKNGLLARPYIRHTKQDC